MKNGIYLWHNLHHANLFNNKNNMTSFENLESNTVYDTEVINKFYQQMGYGDGNHFHKVIWRPFMCDFFMISGPWCQFGRLSEVENVFDELMNEFFDTYPELNDSIKLAFTN
jgi:hypothetical protein